MQNLGGLYLEGQFNKEFFALQVWGAYTWKGLFSQFYGTLFNHLSLTGHQKNPTLF